MKKKILIPIVASLLLLCVSIYQHIFTEILLNYKHFIAFSCLILSFMLYFKNPIWARNLSFFVFLSSSLNFLSLYSTTILVGGNIARNGSENQFGFDLELIGLIFLVFSIILNFYWFKVIIKKIFETLFH